MASVQKKKVLDAQAFTADGNGSAVSVDGKTENFIAFLNISALGAGTSLVVTLQHSPNGTNWFTLVAFTAAVAVGVESKDQAQFATPFQNVYPNLRANLDFTGGVTTGTVTLEIFYDSK